MRSAHIVHRFFHFLHAAKSLLARMRASSHYKELTFPDIESSAKKLDQAWINDDMPVAQRRLVNSQLAAYRQGAPNRTFDVLVDQTRPLIRSGTRPSLLEIGCSSGYYSEILELRDVNVAYRGCDYSPPFVQLAKSLYPEVCFDIEDATALRYCDSSFEIVVSGCCLLHIRDYRRAISEAARVASEYVIFHRTPVLHLSPTRFYKKQAYGVETLEIHFNEQELVRLFAESGLLVSDVATISAYRNKHDVGATKTYLCRKIALT